MGERIEIQAPLTLRDQIEARAQHAQAGELVFLMHDERSWTFRELRQESVRVAHFLARALGRVDEQRPGHVAMLLENQLELASLLGGCAYGGYTLFGVNTGLRGEPLAGVLNQSRARVLVVGERYWPELERVRGSLRWLTDERIFVLRSGASGGPPERDWLRALDAELGPASAALAPPDAAVRPDTGLIIIYTSGTTGLPKGIFNNHAKLCLIGGSIAAGMGLGPADTGYANMPLYHSNALFLGFMPMFSGCARLGLRERFSASRFLDDLRRYGVTHWNYVGEPVHYVITALEQQFGADPERIAREIKADPRIRFRLALGNGASAPDIDKLMQYFGLEDVLELYGSTEAAIRTTRKRGDPRGSVGEITEAAVLILDEDGRECPPAQLCEGRVMNYAEAVGEICRVAPDTGLFQGYFEDASANADKYRGGVYHSGDLGHVQIEDGRRYLFFDGRTADWIRKDGENFSAAQVGRVLREHPDVALAVVYGVPCPVADEWVMAALKLAPDAQFDPCGFYEWCELQCTSGSMDRVWLPDFVRVMSEFDQLTETHKVLVRELRPTHFNRELMPDEPIYWRRRGERAFREFTAKDYEELRGEFARSERLALLG